MSPITNRWHDLTPSGSEDLVKSRFDFGWTKWKSEFESSVYAFEHQKGDVLDIGCSNCQLCIYLRNRGWSGRYTGVDMEKREGEEYPQDIELIVGDAMTLSLPEADTVIMYNLLEHVDDPVALLRKGLKAARRNVLINVPKRNEELWKLGLVEYHQLDKTHRHCGFVREEVEDMARRAGGRVQVYHEVGEVNATKGRNLWNSRLAKTMISAMDLLFSSKRFNEGIWCEVVKE